MYKILNLFPVPLYQEYIDQNLFLNIKQEILEFTKNNYNKFKDNWNCTTKSNFGTNFCEDPRSENLKNLIKSCSIKFLEECKINYKGIIFEDLWINLASFGSHQESHNHIHSKGNNIFSGVFYLNVNKNSGNLILHSPNQLASNLSPISNYSSANIIIEPEEGLLISFPSWVNHEVCPNLSNQDRISVSWNIGIIT